MKSRKRYVQCTDRMCGADDCPNCRPENFQGEVYFEDLEEAKAAKAKETLKATRAKLNEARSILADVPTWPPAVERVKNLEEIIRQMESGKTPPT